METRKLEMAIAHHKAALLAAAALLVISAIFTFGMTLPFALLLFFGYACSRRAPKVVKFMAVLILSLIAALYLRYAGFRSDALDRADKDRSGSSGTHHICAPVVSQDRLSLTGVRPSVSQDQDEARAVRSSSNGTVWFDGPPCHDEGRVRLTLSWIALGVPLTYGFYLFRRRSREHISDQTLIST